jgi:hypothetical protein
MPIWRLIPTDPTDPNWIGSSHRGPVVVRARDEATARDVAASAFDVSVRFTPGAGVKVPPWRRPQCVRAEIIEDSIYPAEGPAEVLDPSFGPA